MDDKETLTSLRTTVLEKYKTLSNELHTLDDTLKQIIKEENESEEHTTINDKITPDELLKLIRELELKISVAGTLVKGSVYSLILQRYSQNNQGNKK
ncbi:uncharacterized protein SCODWIG_02646 [Saccharomycodes ludwigii]|uniref:DASH complex subunit DAD3 n=1 Tax=Saccharomycodes ludwigii TaxID=36035 RepID=A0A376B897_9ASCO|nr:hypothetical protein SCDLUD_001016 [Saccharomycodes ludwigii]KAH3903383.1 hypothetical protein SCDLUD_001016 [Saccharomycodes ludwigii]SSD60885.1 uncharacterized protein SCODWIG_02646 [Saccharomycodes ludwigii]